MSLVCAFSFQGMAAGDEAVPPQLQAQLLAKVATYDRGFRERAGGTVEVAILARPGNSESLRVANLLEAALRREATIGGLPHHVSVIDYKDTPTLVKECTKRSVSILYVPPSFDGEIEAICGALEPLRIRTVTGVPDYVKRCVVLGFRLDAGRPKLLVNLARAERSDIRYKSELLKLAEVYR